MQNFNNHRQFYSPHHFAFYPVILIMIGISFYQAVHNGSERIIWLLIGISFLLIGWASFMMRQHYALSNQNRIIRLEMRFRYYVLTQRKFDEWEGKLSFAQIAALRFASDEELIELIERTVREGLIPNQIKKSVKEWQADHMRV